MGIVLVAFLAATASASRREEHVNFETDQFISQGGEPVELIISGSILESYVLALNIAECTELSPNNSTRQRRTQRDGLRASQS